MKYSKIMLFVASLVLIGVVHQFLSADVITVQPVVSTSYLAVPTVKQEIITTAPSPSYVWVAGHWDRSPDKWVWNQGSWVQPPFGNAYWVPGYWQHRSGKYVWQTAHWAASNQGVIVAKPITVPATYEEVQPTAPAQSNVVWQPGHWEWRGSWLWIPGEYVQSASPTAVWVNGQWVVGAGGNWNWSPAHWQVS